MNLRDLPANREVLYSWGRYLFWAELRRRDWDDFMTHKGEDLPTPEWLAVSCYWAASLYVVIEGWEAARLSDPIIDALLGVSDYRDIIRKLRNGTFHYQPLIISPKVTGFFQSYEVNLWLHFLHEEFCRWLRDCVDAVERAALLSPGDLEEWRTNFACLIGWVPLRPAEENLKALKREFDDAQKELDTSGSTSKEAHEVRAVLAQYDTIVQQTAADVRESRREMLVKFGLNPDQYIP